ncbi:hypothetical protein CYMTET_23313 [Cymbomonas tetramitiformis]|uniref:phosphatidyl-N-methylethanolamine N-methyltransferase n=1 Tax=Cymbomonas tetramitiformis TaxID=36881 RepID=A0AAE0FGE5_9CHLO|nr:hypothetical protein CYMTET_31881 [Cymbomonas tetramitiformis]KAK3268169.1 hypothetical protein CYMTET_23313 [Cymbomonas tetramitiformis]
MSGTMLDQELLHLKTAFSAGLTLNFLSDHKFWLIVGVLSVPHWLYAYLWLRPEDIKAALGGGKSHPVYKFAYIAWVIKIIQLTSLAIWYMAVGVPSVSTFGYVQLAVGFALFAFGQFLNMSMVKAIGVKGVYYGTRLGLNIPWCTDFPFNVFDHPQYIGSVLSYWGMFLMPMTATHAQQGLVALFAVPPLFYSISGYIESQP